MGCSNITVENSKVESERTGVAQLVNAGEIQERRAKEHAFQLFSNAREHNFARSLTLVCYLSLSLKLSFFVSFSLSLHLSIYPSFYLTIRLAI